MRSTRDFEMSHILPHKVKYRKPLFISNVLVKHCKSVPVIVIGRIKIQPIKTVYSIDILCEHYNKYM